MLLNFDHQIACRNLAVLCQRTEDEIWHTVFASDLQLKYETGTITTRQFLQCLEDTFRVSLDPAEASHAASAIFNLNYPIIPLVTRLRLQGHSLGILSNTCEIHWEYASKGRYRIIQDLFKVRALSFELNSVKPEGEIYHRAADLVGAQPEEIFFVDDRAENVDAAREQGYDAVVYRDPHQLAGELACRNLLAGY